MPRKGKEFVQVRKEKPSKDNCRDKVTQTKAHQRSDDRNGASRFGALKDTINKITRIWTKNNKNSSTNMWLISRTHDAFNRRFDTDKVLANFKMSE